MTIVVINSNLVLVDEVVGAHHNQVDGVVKAGNPNTDEVYGYVSYTLYGKKLHINYITVGPQYQRMGLAKHMVRYLKQTNPGYVTDWGVTTPQGAKLKHRMERKSVRRTSTRKGSFRRKS